MCRLVAARRKARLSCSSTDAGAFLLPFAVPTATKSGATEGECITVTGSRLTCRACFGPCGRTPFTCTNGRAFLQQQHCRQQRQMLRLLQKTWECDYCYPAAAHSSSSRLWFVLAFTRHAASGLQARTIFSASSRLPVAMFGGSYEQAQSHRLQQRQQQTHQLHAQQARSISTKRRRYFKMRKFHKKKYKKKLMRAKKVPFVEINRPKRTWKTLRQMQLVRKEFRRGIPGKGARMLRLKRQR